MPKFGLSPEEVKALSYFLKSRVREPYYETPMMRLFKEREEKRLEKKNLLKPVSAGKELIKNPTPEGPVLVNPWKGIKCLAS